MKQHQFVVAMLSVLFALMWASSIRAVPEEIPTSAFAIFILAPFAIFSLFGKMHVSSSISGVVRAILASAAFLMILSVLSGAWSEEPMRVFRVTYTLFAGVVAFVVVLEASCRCGDAARIYERYALICGIAIIVLALASVLPPLRQLLTAFAGSSSAEGILGERDRFAGLFKNPNQLGIALSASIPLLLGRYMCLPSAAVVRRLVWFIMIAAGLFLLVQTGSKVNLFLGLGGITVMLVGISASHRSAIKSILAVSVACGVVAVIVVVGGEYVAWANPRTHAMLSSIVSGDVVTLSTVQTRMDLWRASIVIGAEAPLMGSGAGSKIYHYSHSHNVIIDYWRRLGVPGLLGIMCFVSASVVLSMKSLGMTFSGLALPRRDLAISLSLTVSVISYWASNMSSDSMGPQTSLFLFVPLGVAASVPAFFAAQQRARRAQDADDAALLASHGSWEKFEGKHVC